MSKIVNLFQPELTADELLEKAKGELKDVFIFGYDEDGHLVTAGSNLTKSEVLYLIEAFKHRMFSNE